LTSFHESIFHCKGFNGFALKIRQTSNGQTTIGQKSMGTPQVHGL